MAPTLNRTRLCVLKGSSCLSKSACFPKETWPESLGACCNRAYRFIANNKLSQSTKLSKALQFKYALLGWARPLLDLVLHREWQPSSITGDVKKMSSQTIFKNSSHPLADVESNVPGIAPLWHRCCQKHAKTFPIPRSNSPRQASSIFSTFDAGNSCNSPTRASPRWRNLPAEKSFWFCVLWCGR